MGSVKYMYGSGSFTIYVSTVTRKHICFKLRVYLFITKKGLIVTLLLGAIVLIGMKYEL